MRIKKGCESSVRPRVRISFEGLGPPPSTHCIHPGKTPGVRPRGWATWSRGSSPLLLPGQGFCLAAERAREVVPIKRSNRHASALREPMATSEPWEPMQGNLNEASGLMVGGRRTCPGAETTFNSSRDDVLRRAGGVRFAYLAAFELSSLEVGSSRTPIRQSRFSSA